MKVSLFYLPIVGTRADITAGMAGTRSDLYQQMLHDVSAQARLADGLGYDSISFTEHHLHIEGFELSNNPVLLDLYIGMQTKRLRVGQLGIVLPANNPLRVAEDIAMLDHMTGGSRQRRLCARVSAALGRCVCAADAWHQRCNAGSTRRNRRNESRSLRREFPHRESGVDRRTDAISRQVLADSASRGRRGISKPRASTARGPRPAS